jgi:hypothetical protein
MTHLVSTILVLGPCDFKLDLELQTWIYEKNGLKLVNGQKLSWKTRAKNRTNRAKNAATQNVQMFHVFFAVQILIFHVVFWGNSIHAWIDYIIYLSPCHRMIFGYEVIVWMETSQIYSGISYPGCCFVLLTLLICRKVAWYYGTVSSGISQFCTALSMPFNMWN